jgi:hypothetical protein
MAQLRETFRALQSPLRRSVMFSLREQGTPSNGLTVPEEVIDSTVTDRIGIKLHHEALPMLEEYGFVRWDRRQDLVYRGPEFESLDPFLEVIENNYDE